MTKQNNLIKKYTLLISSCGPHLMDLGTKSNPFAGSLKTLKGKEWIIRLKWQCVYKYYYQKTRPCDLSPEQRFNFYFLFQHLSEDLKII